MLNISSLDKYVDDSYKYELNIFVLMNMLVYDLRGRFYLIKRYY